jgi:mannosyltransferase OCH1-like enzyme
MDPGREHANTTLVLTPEKSRKTKIETKPQKSEKKSTAEEILKIIYQIYKNNFIPQEKNCYNKNYFRN